MRRLLLLVVALISPSMSHAIEEPAYEVVRSYEGFELRRYAPYVVAEVVLQASAEDAGSQAFPVLAGYIFGKNKGSRKLAMTAPVTQVAEPMRIPMTAPVTQSADDGRMRVQFVLPKDISLQAAPEPLDGRVQLREVPAATWAVIQYSGTWSQANYQEHLAKLTAATKSAGILTQGEPVFARYNGPTTPWFMRRNEVWLAVP